jgi:hypothetical protein
MRYFISALLLTALIVGWQRSAIAQASVSGDVVAGEDFVLGWPQNAPKAHIKIPASAIGEGEGKVAPGTQVTISLVTESSESVDHPKRFKDHAKNTGKKVFAPIVAFSADPSFTITNEADYFTIAMCVQYHGADTPRFNKAQLARAPANTTSLEFLTPANEKADLCYLRCTPDCNGSSSARFLRQLFAGSPFSASPLYAAPEPEGGLGGKGGSTSPFAAVEQ